MVNLSFGLVALGANLPASGQPATQTLRRTLAILHADPEVTITATSRIWMTPAHPAGSGPDYANAAARILTPLDPDALLARLHRIEADAGRDRGTGRWSARVLDLDLLAYEDRVLPDAARLRAWIDLPPAEQQRRMPENLLLPHPRMQDRGFVLGPLAEIAPGWRHPVLGLTVGEMLARLAPAALAGMRPLTAADAAPDA